MRPIIGILDNNLGGLINNYAVSVEKAGGSPLIIPILGGIDSIKAVIDNLDGIIFSGGTDIEPMHYDEFPRFGLGDVIPERDHFEIELLKYILEEKNIPIVGICRGMQLLNVVLGGSLYQNIEREKPEGLKHFLNNFPGHYSSHPVSIKKDSKFFSIFKEESIGVNSFHNQGIKKLGSGLKSTMFAPDDIIEGVEMDGKRFIVGVQFHPEMMTEKNEQQLLLFKEIIKQC